MSSLSSFSCRRFCPSDVGSVHRLLTQQRLAGVATAEAQRSGEGEEEEVGAERSSAASSAAASASSLFSARAAANLGHVRRWWGVADCSELVRLLSAQWWLSLVVEDATGVVAVAAFHSQPSVAALREVLAGPLLSPSTWPAWLPSLACRSPLSPAASRLSSLHPHCTAFLSFFACTVLSNARQEREVREQLLQTAFNADDRITRIALVLPTPAPQRGEGEEGEMREKGREGDAGRGGEDGSPAPPLIASPLAPAFRLVDDGGWAQGSGCAPPLLCCYLCAPHQPRIRVRRAVLEDHDDLLPLFEAQTALTAGQVGPFCLAQLLEPADPPQPTTTAASPTSSSSSSGGGRAAAALLSLLSSPSSVALVAEVGGRAVGLLCATSEVDVSAVVGAFDLRPFEQRWTAGAGHGLDGELGPASSEALSRRLAEVRVALLDPLASASISSSALTSAASTSSAEKGSRVGSGGSGDSGEVAGSAVPVVLDAGAVWVCWSSALSDALRGEAPAVVSAGAGSLSEWWSSVGAEQQLRLSATSELFERLWREAASTVAAAIAECHGAGGEAEEGAALAFTLLQRWAEAAAVRALHQPPDPSPSTPLLCPPPRSTSSSPLMSSSSVFCVSCFVLSDAHALQAADFLLPTFAAFPSRSLLLLSLPHSQPTFPLLQHWTQLTPRPGGGYPHAVYVLHRATALSLQRGGRGLEVAIASLKDEADVQQLLRWEEQCTTAATTTTISSSATLGSAAAREVDRWRVALRSPSPSPSSVCCLTVRCAGELVGLVRTTALQSPQQLRALHAHFAIQPHHSPGAGQLEGEEGGGGVEGDGFAGPQGAASEAASAAAAALVVRHWVLNPLFAVHCPALLLEVLRLSEGRLLLYQVGADSSSFHPLLVRHLPQCRPLTLPSPPLPQGPFDAVQYPQASPDSAEPQLLAPSPTSSSPSPALSPQSLSSGSSRSGDVAGGGSFVAPGPPLLPLLSPSPPRPLCVACGAADCPSFALYAASYPALSRPRVEVNSRLVIVGAGHTALAALERLTFDPHLHFSHLTLIARHLPHTLTAEAGSVGCGGCVGAAVSACLCHVLEDSQPSDLSFDRARMRRLRLDARVRFIRGEVQDIDHQHRRIRYTQLKPDGQSDAPAPHPLSELAFDELLLATGLQPSTRHLSVFEAPRGTPGEQGRGEGDGGRHEGAEAFAPLQPPLQLLGGHHRPSSLSASSPAEAAAAAVAVPFSSPQPSTSPSLAPVSRLRSGSGRSSASLPPLLSPSPSSSASRPSSSTSSSSSFPTKRRPSEVEAERVRGVHRMGNAESAHRLAQQLAALHLMQAAHGAEQAEDARAGGEGGGGASLLPLVFPPSTRVVVSGCSLLALSTLSALLSLGVSGESLAWVHRAAHGSGALGLDAQQQPRGDGEAMDEHRPPMTLSAAVFGEDGSPALSAALQALAHERVRIIPQATIASVVVEPRAELRMGRGGGAGDDCGDASTLHSVALCTGEWLACDALLLCDGAHVDERMLGCIDRLSLVFDGRLVVDEQCRTRLPHLRAAGPMAKFQRSIAAAADVQHPSHLHHRMYHSAAVGRLAAHHLSRAFSPATAQPQSHSARSSLTRLRSHSCAAYTRLPGGLAFLQCTTAPPLQPTGSSGPPGGVEGRELRLCQSFSSYSFAVSYSPSTLRVVRVLYWGAYEVPVVNLRRLISLPLTYLNRLLQRWEEGHMRSLLLFLQQDWAAPLYSPAFHAAHQHTLHSLTGTHRQHIAPILTRLSHTLHLHAAQQRAALNAAAQQRRGPSPVTSSATAGGEAGAASLLSLTACLPLQLREAANRALLRFLDQQRPLLPSSLHALPPFSTTSSCAAPATALAAGM